MVEMYRALKTKPARKRNRELGQQVHCTKEQIFNYRYQAVRMGSRIEISVQSQRGPKRY